jgi:hypothetical protein
LEAEVAEVFKAVRKKKAVGGSSAGLVESRLSEPEPEPEPEDVQQVMEVWRVWSEMAERFLRQGGRDRSPLQPTTTPQLLGLAWGTGPIIGVPLNAFPAPLDRNGFEVKSKLSALSREMRDFASSIVTLAGSLEVWADEARWRRVLLDSVKKEEDGTYSEEAVAVVREKIRSAQAEVKGDLSRFPVQFSENVMGWIQGWPKRACELEGLLEDAQGDLTRAEREESRRRAAGEETLVSEEMRREVLENLVRLQCEYNEGRLFRTTHVPHEGKMEVSWKMQSEAMTGDGSEGHETGNLQVSLEMEVLVSSEQLSWEVVVSGTGTPAGERVNLGYTVVRQAQGAQSCHPHVNGGSLCTGDASASIGKALKDGRFLDAVDLVESVLRTYDAEGAYWKIGGFGAELDCGCVVDETQGWDTCSACGSTWCEFCFGRGSFGEDGRAICRDCGDLCSNCMYTCTFDEMQQCAGCGVALCRECVITCEDGACLCQDCVDKGTHSFRCHDCEGIFYTGQSEVFECHQCAEVFCEECIEKADGEKYLCLDHAELYEMCSECGMLVDRDEGNDTATGWVCDDCREGEEEEEEEEE